MLLTSPLIATCGLSLTIPVAMLADFFLRDATFGAVYPVSYTHLTLPTKA